MQPPALDTAPAGDASGCTSLQHSTEELEAIGGSQEAYGMSAPSALGCTVYPLSMATHQRVLDDSKLFYSTLIDVLNKLGIVLKVGRAAAPGGAWCSRSQIEGRANVRWASPGPPRPAHCVIELHGVDVTVAIGGDVVAGGCAVNNAAGVVRRAATSPSRLGGHTTSCITQQQLQLTAAVPIVGPFASYLVINPARHQTGHPLIPLLLRIAPRTGAQDCGPGD
jgi:hypothetical protein